MSYNQPEGDLITLKGNKFKQVEDFVYLGLTLHKRILKNGYHLEIKNE